MARRYRVGIVGFGVAGGTAAYLLARDGHHVTVLEQADRLGPVGAGVLLQPSGQAVLAKLGWLDRVLARSAPLEELYARHADGREMINNRYPDYDPAFRAYGVHRGVLFAAVHDAVRAEPVEVRLTCRVTGRSVGPDGVTLADSCGDRHGPFDFVLAADGSRSVLRAACRFPAHVTRYGHGTLWVNAPGTGVPGRLLQVVRGTRKLFGLLPLGDGLCSLYWGLPVREFPHLRARGLPALKREVLAFAPEAAEVLDFVHDFDQLLFTTYQHVWMPRWFDRHTLFVGDAAHAMSPHLGQGINLALLGADRLAACLRTAPDPYSAFSAFRTARRAQVRYYGAVTYALSPFFQSDWPVLGWGRDVFLPLLPKVPWVKRQMLLTVSGLKGGFLKGRTTV
jgi:2-polyprenyl-6-methoxyphenol hydroxylase-like FAD-dependent oxidoreductase